MKNILITDDCLVNGEPVAAGQILRNVAQPLASELLCSGRAVEAPAGPAPQIRVADPEVAHRDPKPAKKAARAK
jgi:hypothetical protein